MFMMMTKEKVPHKVRIYMDNYSEILRESESPTPISWPVREVMSEAFRQRKSIEKMSETKIEQSNSDKPTITANDTHNHCGTPECCGKCSPSVSENAKE